MKYLRKCSIWREVTEKNPNKRKEVWALQIVEKDETDLVLKTLQTASSKCSFTQRSDDKEENRKKQFNDKTNYEEEDSPVLSQIDPIQLLLGSNEFQVLLNHILEIKSKANLILSCVNSGQVKLTVKENVEMEEKIKQHFPMQSINNLLEVEEILQDEEVSKQLFTKLSLIGGYNYKNCIRRCLHFLFSNKLASLCSWTGQKNNYKVGNTKVLAILNGAVKTRYQDMTDKEYELVVMEWLRYGKFRDKGNTSA